MVDRINIVMGMTPITNMSIKEATVVTQTMNGLIPSKNHILANFGEQNTPHSKNIPNSETHNVGIIYHDVQVVFMFHPECDLFDLQVLGFMRIFPLKNIGG